MNRGRLDGWCILRTAGQRTLPLARSLALAGFEVWTPAKTIERRGRRKRAVIAIELPITPTFVFARSHHLGELIGLTKALSHSHPRFSILRLVDRFPVVTDREIDRLREAERDAAEDARRRDAKQRRRSFPVGERVHVAESGQAWTGLSGVVIAGDERTALVNFGGSLTVKVDTWLLVSDIVQPPQSGGSDIAAQAA